MKNKISVLMMIILLAFATGTAQVATNLPYTLEQSVIASGGGQSSTGGAFSLDGTIGQPITGISSLDNIYTLIGGFWTADFLLSPTAESQTISAVEDTPAAIVLSGSDPDNAPLTYIIVTNPARGVLSGTGANLTYTPVGNYFGADGFTFKVTNGTRESAVATVTIKVAPVNDNPNAANDSAVVTEDSGANIINVLSNDSILPDEGEILTVSSVTNAANGTVAIANGSAAVSYAPNADFHGADSFTYTVSDGNGGSDTATVNITITSVNDAPTIITQNVYHERATNTAGTPIARVNDAEDAEDSLNVTVNDSFAATVNNVTVSNISVNSIGIVTASVAANCQSTDSTFALKVTDSDNLTAATTLNVTATDETVPPVIDPIQKVTVQLPPDSSTNSTAVSFPLPTATDNCGGAVSVETNPASGSQFEVGTTTVQVTATDQAGNQSAATFTVMVREIYSFRWVQYSDLLFREEVLNQVTAGSNVPLRFSLNGYKGDNPYSQAPTSQQINCSTFAPMGAATVLERFAPDPYYSNLYDFYQTTWKTKTNWRFSCRRLTLYLNDGTTRSLNFYFK